MVTFLLTLHHKVEAGIVHAYPVAGQLATGIERLEHRLDNLVTEGRWWKKSKPARRGFGLAQCAFFSGHPQAKAEGATANLLLIVNETQDQVERIVDRRFTPMRASTNATCLYVGTVRTTSDLLWRTKTRLERLQAEDGIERVFCVSPANVASQNPHYGAFVDEQVRTKGRNHPAVMTELFNEPVDVAAGLFPERRRALMLGAHPRLRGPLAGEVYVALVDVGGQDEAGSGGANSEWRIANGEGLENPARDYTICTVARVVREASEIGPVYEVVDLFVDHGSRHFQDAPGVPSLFARLLAFLRHWNVAAVVSDQSGVGQGITDALKKSYPRGVFGFDFGGGRKARLGNDFLSLVETGRFKYFRDGHDDEGADCWWFFVQCERCGYELAEGQPIERGLRWGVSPTVRVITQQGSELVHDDRLLSAALLAELDRLIREGQWFVATGESAVIRAEERGSRGAEEQGDSGAWA
jgi:hypothetical protein